MAANELQLTCKCLSGNKPRILSLPTEVVALICSFLAPVDLNATSLTCRDLRSQGLNDLLWRRHVQDNVPGSRLSSPSPCQSFRELYQAHDPYWFLPRYKIWFSDIPYTGKLIIVRYDPRRGCIEGYRLIAARAPPQYEPWEYDEDVIIHTFTPRVYLHLDVPVLQLNVSDEPEAHTFLDSDDESNPFAREVPMPVLRAGTYSSIFLTRSVEYRPGMLVWPPPETIPHSSPVRCRSQNAFRGTEHHPQRRSEANGQTFRIRNYIRFSQQSFDSIFGGGDSHLHHMEDVQTFSTLDEKLYTPTAEYPWRGIWVGDYSGHGCEFLLMHQEDMHPLNERSIRRREDESSEDFIKRRNDERLYRGNLKAIKLTGDPNVPRGEYTFIADDLGPDGFVRIAEEKPFQGARIVKSRGHIAERFFRSGMAAMSLFTYPVCLLTRYVDKYIESQLIMINTNKIAQYWLGFGHISFYERINIDDFLSPYNSRPT